MIVFIGGQRVGRVVGNWKFFRSHVTLSSAVIIIINNYKKLIVQYFIIFLISMFFSF